MNTLIEQSLPTGYCLQDAYTIKEVHAMDSEGIVYLAEETEGNQEVLIRECFPHLSAVRAEEGVQVPDAAKARFLEIAAALQQLQSPFLPEIRRVFAENGTAYCVTAEPKSAQPFVIGEDAPCTPAYIQSLGILLCDISTALLSAGLTLGALSADSFFVGDHGAFFLNIQRIFEASIHTPSSLTVTEEIKGFLAGLCEKAPSEELADAPVLPLLQGTLQQTYQDPQQLREALICAAGEVTAPKKKTGFPWARTLICAGFLAAALTACGLFLKYGMSLHQKVQLGLIRPDVISVWLPLEESLDAEDQQRMYEQLAASFEAKYPGFGVDIYMMDTTYFQTALTEHQHGEIPAPVVVMNASESLAQEHGTDLEALTDALPSVYAVRMQDFETAIPLGYTMPALFWNPYKDEHTLETYLQAEELPEETIEFTELSSEIGYDASIAPLMKGLMEEYSVTLGEADFSLFLENQTTAPILASTEMLAQIQGGAETSGVVEMYPITVDGDYPLQFERLCYVDHAADANSRDIGMLWLQYLLTEEAQQSLFVEQYGCFPLHADAMRDMAAGHGAFDWMQEGDSE